MAAVVSGCQGATEAAHYVLGLVRDESGVEIVQLYSLARVR